MKIEVQRIDHKVNYFGASPRGIRRKTTIVFRGPPERHGRAPVSIFNLYYRVKSPTY